MHKQIRREAHHLLEGLAASAAQMIQKTRILWVKNDIKKLQQPLLFLLAQNVLYGVGLEVDLR